MGKESNAPKDVQESIRDVLGPNHVTLLCLVQLEVKPDKLENRAVALTDYRLVVFTPRVPAKVELNIPFLDIRTIESQNADKLVIGTENRKLLFKSFDSETKDVDNVINIITQFLTSTFPSQPVEKLVGLDVAPADRLVAMRSRIDNLQKREPGPCGGFSAAYKCMCDYHGLTFLEEVAWDVDTIYLSQDTKQLTLSDFDHFDGRHLIPIIAALEHNKWFTTLNARNVRLTVETANEILKVLKTNSCLEEVWLSNVGMKWDFAQKLAQALMGNHGSPVVALDLSNNYIEDKGLSHLCGPFSSLSRGLVHLNLSKTGITAKGVNRLAEALSGNRFISSSLVYLDLSENVLKGEEITNLLAFLAQPNALTTLNLSGTECSLDTLSGALQRGCNLTLQRLDLSHNYFSKKGSRDMIPMSWKQFFVSAMSLKYVNLSNVKLPPEALKQMLLGISANSMSSHELELDISSSGLGSLGAEVLEQCIPDLRNVTSLDISDNSFDMDIINLSKSIRKNRTLKKLAIGKNFNNIKQKHLSQVLESVVQMIQKDDSSIESLSLADSKLRMDTAMVINALGGNTSLTEIDLSGNLMGDIVVRVLAKALQINTRLQTIYWDRNSTSPSGFQDIAAALEKNYTVRKMPTPIQDATAALKQNPEITEWALGQIESLLQRNHSPRKFSSDQAYRLQQGFLISSTQQMMDKLVVEIQDTLRDLQRSDKADSARHESSKATDAIENAYNSRQLFGKFQEMALKSEKEGTLLNSKLKTFGNDLTWLVDRHLKKTLTDMLNYASDRCPAVMQQRGFKEDLKKACEEKSTFPGTFVESLLLEQVGTDIMNKISELNLAVASHMSDRLLDGVMESLERSHKRLSQHLKGEIDLGKSPNISQEGDRDSRRSLLRNKGNETPSPAASPKLSMKRKSQYSRRLRPQSVVDPNDVAKAVKLQDAKREETADVLSRDKQEKPLPTIPAEPALAEDEEDKPVPVPAPRRRKPVKVGTGDSNSMQNIQEELESEKALKVDGGLDSQVNRKDVCDGDKEIKTDASKEAIDVGMHDIKEESPASTDTATTESSLDSRESTPTSEVLSRQSPLPSSSSATDFDELLPLDTGHTQLQHLAKDRPKRAKTRAVSKAVLQQPVIEEVVHEVDSGVSSFFEDKSTPSSDAKAIPQTDTHRENGIASQPKTEEKHKDEDSAKKKGWFGGSGANKGNLATGISHFFHRGKSSGVKSPEAAPKKYESPPVREEKKTPEREETPKKTEDDNKEEETEIKPTPKRPGPPRGIGLPGMGGGGADIFAEMRAKRLSMIKTEEEEEKAKGKPVEKQTEKPVEKPREKAPAPRMAPARPPTFCPPSKETPRASLRTSLTPSDKGDESPANGVSKTKVTPPVRPGKPPPPVAPKPNKPSPGGIESSKKPAPSSKSAPPPRPPVPSSRVSEPDENRPEGSEPKEKDASIRKRPSVKERASMIDQNSNQKGLDGVPVPAIRAKSQSYTRETTPEKIDSPMRSSDPPIRQSRVELPCRRSGSGDSNRLSTGRLKPQEVETDLISPNENGSEEESDDSDGSNESLNKKHEPLVVYL